MSTNPKAENTSRTVDESLSLREMIIVLIKHYGHHSGYYDLMIEFKIGVGTMGPDPANTLPGAMVGVSKFGLVPSIEIGPLSVDAAEVNPSPATAI